MSEKTPGMTFVDRVDEFVSSLGTRIPEPDRSRMESDISEWIQTPTIFMRNLVAVVADDRIPLLPAERDMLIDLMRWEGMDLAVVERLNVVDDLPAKGRGADPGRPDTR